VFKELRAQGFIRARIDGEVVRAGQPARSWTCARSTPSRVVDRFKVRDDMQQRLAESFETALRLADGMARVAFMDDDGADELIFSARFACPLCGYSIPSWNRAVLLQQPGRRLPDLRRPGREAVLRPGAGGRRPEQLSWPGRGPRLGPAQRLLLPAAQLAGGALRLRRRHPLRAKLPKKNARSSCSAAARRHRVQLRQRAAATFTTAPPFEGMIPNMERRYRETDSNAWCARNWPSTSAPSPAPLRRHALREERATCSSPSREPARGHRPARGEAS
jgi:excinuclease ABC subunit A